MVNGFVMNGSIDPVEQIKKHKEELLKRLAEEDGDTVADDLNTDDEPAQGGTADGTDHTDVNTDKGNKEQKEDDQNSDTWKSRFLVLQGKYDNEVPRMAQEIRDLKAEISTLTEKVQNATQGAATTQGNTSLSDEVMAELEDKFGPELMDAFMKLADSRVDSQVSERMKKVEQKVEEVSTSNAQQRAQADFESALTRACPGWQSLNTDEGFNVHIRETVDPISGESLFSLLNEAYQSGDAAKVARIFNSYNKPTQIGGTNAEAVWVGVKRAVTEVVKILGIVIPIINVSRTERVACIKSCHA